MQRSMEWNISFINRKDISVGMHGKMKVMYWKMPTARGLSWRLTRHSKSQLIAV